MTVKKSDAGFGVGYVMDCHGALLLAMTREKMLAMTNGLPRSVAPRNDGIKRLAMTGWIATELSRSQ